MNKLYSDSRIIGILCDNINIHDDNQCVASVLVYTAVEPLALVPVSVSSGKTRTRPAWSLQLEVAVR